MRCIFIALIAMISIAFGVTATAKDYGHPKESCAAITEELSKLIYAYRKKAECRKLWPTIADCCVAEWTKSGRKIPSYPEEDFHKICSRGERGELPAKCERLYDKYDGVDKAGHSCKDKPRVKHEKLMTISTLFKNICR